MDECRSAEPRTQDQNWNSLGDLQIPPVAVRSRFFLGIDRERKTPTQILLRGASILPVGAPRTWGIARVLFALGGMARMGQQVHERRFSETLLSIDLAR